MAKTMRRMRAAMANLPTTRMIVLRVCICIYVKKWVSFEQSSPPTCLSWLGLFDLGIYWRISEVEVTISGQNYKISKKIGLVGIGCRCPGKSMIGIFEISSSESGQSSLCSDISVYRVISLPLTSSIFFSPISISPIFLLRSSFFPSSL